MKDTPTRAFFPGYVVPGLLAVVVLINVLTRKAYWPRRGGSLIVFTDGWRVTGSVLLEVGVAVGFFAWYILANDDRREHLSRPILGAAILVAVLGVAMFGYGFME